MLGRDRNAVDGQARVGGEIAGAAVFVVAGAVVAAWRASQRSETGLNARTWARLLPPKDPSEDRVETFD